MSWFKDFTQSLAAMLGREPQLPKADQLTPEMAEVLARKRTPEAKAARREFILHEKATFTPRNKWRRWRWASIILINFLFVISFQADVQLVEGALTASRFVGFHMADLNSALQVTLAYKHVVVNLIIGTVTVFILWWLVGGRSFCSWACPYHLLGEWAEWLHLKLAARGWVKDHPMDRRGRTVLYVIFAVLALATGYTVFETISPVGIVSRALIYGGSLALLWVALLLVLEVFWSRRFWCRYACPIGLTYGAVGLISPLKVVHDTEKCMHEGECRQVCLVPHVLHMTKLGYGTKPVSDIGADCTRCGMCIDACPTGALKFKVSALGDLL